MMHTYTVHGHWPFPIDMLRSDQAEPASEADRDLIKRLSRPHAGDRTYFQDVDITLKSLNKPNTKRWKSFRWSVLGDAAYAAQTAEHTMRLERDRLYQNALAKLTAAEIDALRWKWSAGNQH